jgi:hypothetical protein
VKTVSNRRLSVLLSLTTITVLGGGLSAQAEMIEGADTSANFATQKAANATPAPIPGTMTTSAAALASSDRTSQQAESAAQTDEKEVAQIDVAPGQATRGGSSYIGVAGNVGIGGDSALGEDVSFTVISKIGLTNSISARPSIVIDDDPVILIPITYDFSIRSADAFEDTLSVAPYIGGGIGISTGGDEDDGDDDEDNDGDVGVLLTGGVDVPLGDRFTGTAAVNVGFFDDTEVGLIVGVGYNF